MAGNVIAGFNMDGPDGLVVYFQQYGLAAMDYLALHEVAHDTVTGLIMNFATADRTDVFIPGTPNWANENLANSLAAVTMEALGLSLGDLNPTAGWQTGAHWTVNP